MCWTVCPSESDVTRAGLCVPSEKVTCVGLCVPVRMLHVSDYYHVHAVIFCRFVW